MKHFIPSIEPFKLHLRAYILSERFHALMTGTFDKFFQTWKYPENTIDMNFFIYFLTLITMYFVIGQTLKSF